MTENPYTLTMNDILRETGMSRLTIYRWMAAGTFPKSRKTGLGKNGTIRWSTVEFADWVAQRDNPDTVVAE